jgi:hypothetical protein
MSIASVLLASAVFAKEWLTTPFEDESDGGDAVALSPDNDGPPSLGLFLRNLGKPDFASLGNGFFSPMQLDIPPFTLDLPFGLAGARDNTGFDSLSLAPFDSDLAFFGKDDAQIPGPNGLWIATSELPTGLPDFGISPVLIPATAPGSGPSVAPTPVPEPGSTFMVVIGVVSLLATLKLRSLKQA